MKHIIRDRPLTDEEAERYRKIREQVEGDVPHLLLQHFSRTGFCPEGVNVDKTTQMKAAEAAIVLFEAYQKVRDMLSDEKDRDAFMRAVAADLTQSVRVNLNADPASRGRYEDSAYALRDGRDILAMAYDPLTTPEERTGPDKVLLDIQQELDGVEWDSNTPNEIAQILISAGYRVRDLNDVDLPPAPATVKIRLLKGGTITWKGIDTDIEVTGNHRFGEEMNVVVKPDPEGEPDVFEIMDPDDDTFCVLPKDAFEIVKAEEGGDAVGKATQD